MNERQVAPIFSSREEESELREALDAFIVELAERVDLLQDAESASDWSEVQRLSGDLAREASRLGFTPLAAAALAVVRACAEDKADAAQTALVEVTGVARRVRLGYRGAI